MVLFSYPKFHTQARQALSDAGRAPTKLVLLHTGVTLGVGLVLRILEYVLELGIAGTGGLSGIGTRTMLEFFQSVLSLVDSLVLPFWAIGYLFLVLQIIRQQPVSSRSLLSGFRCWGPVLRTLLLRGILNGSAALLGAQLGFLLFIFTPAAGPLLHLSQEAADPYAILQDPAALSAVLPMVPWAAIGALLFLTPVLYRTRFARYIIMDAPETGAIRAVLQSFRLTRRRFVPLLVLDLHFWWYYGLELLTLVMGIGHMLLPLWGVSLPMGAGAAMLVCCLAAAICRLGLYVWKRNQVFVTYALLYTHLKANPQVPPRPVARDPWNY